MWNLQVPSKIKINMWCALRRVIPGMGVLAHRHFKVSTQFPICRDGAEDIKHLLFTCGRAHKVWKALGVMDRIEKTFMVDHSSSVVLEELLRWPAQNLQFLAILVFMR